MTAAPRDVPVMRPIPPPTLRRGQVVLATLQGTGERQPYVVVSNDRRNRGLSSVLAARVSTSPKPDIPTIVELGAADPVQGYVMCDEVMLLWRDEVIDEAGPLSDTSLERVAVGLASALALG